MFHHLEDDPEGEEGYEGLVRSTEFTYANEKEDQHSSSPIYSKLITSTQRSYQRAEDGSYRSALLPPVEFTYAEVSIQKELREFRVDSLEHMPIGIDGSVYQWVDLNGEGFPGLLSEQAGEWYYKRNLSPANIGDLNCLMSFANSTTIRSRILSFICIIRLGRAEGLLRKK